jgi:hypothetical protein
MRKEAVRLPDSAKLHSYRTVLPYVVLSLGGEAAHFYAA